MREITLHRAHDYNAKLRTDIPRSDNFTEYGDFLLHSKVTRDSSGTFFAFDGTEHTSSEELFLYRTEIIQSLLHRLFEMKEHLAGFSTQDFWQDAIVIGPGTTTIPALRGFLTDMGMNADHILESVSCVETDKKIASYLREQGIRNENIVTYNMDEDFVDDAVYAYFSESEDKQGKTQLILGTAVPPELVIDSIDAVGNKLSIFAPDKPITICCSLVQSKRAYDDPRRNEAKIIEEFLAAHQHEYDGTFRFETRDLSSEIGMDTNKMVEQGVVIVFTPN